MSISSGQASSIVVTTGSTLAVSLDPGHTLGALSGINATVSVIFDPGHELGSIRGNSNTLTVFLPDTGHELGSIRGIANTIAVDSVTASGGQTMDDNYKAQRVMIVASSTNSSLVVNAPSTGTFQIFIPDTGHTLGNVFVTNIPTVTANAGTGSFTVQLDPGHTLGSISNTGFNVNNSPTVVANAGTGTLTVTFDPAHTIGMLVANQSINNNQVAGSAISTSAAGVQKVGVVGNAGAIFDGATGTAVPANAIYNAARAATANPTNATGGNVVGMMADKAGRIVVTLGQIRELIGIQQTTVSSATETTIITAGAAGVFNDLVALIITTAGAAAQTITLKDATAGTTRFIINYPNAALAPGAPFILCLGFAIPQAAAAANWTVTQSAATACNYTAVFLKNT